jgi:hypothetical protein
MSGLFRSGERLGEYQALPDPRPHAVWRKRIRRQQASGGRHRATVPVVHFIRVTPLVAQTSEDIIS